jgi:hypothetical protein
VTGLVALRLSLSLELESIKLWRVQTVGKVCRRLTFCRVGYFYATRIMWGLSVLSRS